MGAQLSEIYYVQDNPQLCHPVTFVRGGTMLGRIFKAAAMFLFLASMAIAQTIPAGTHLTVRTSSELNSGTAKVGDRFEGTLAHSIVVGGQTVAKAGTPVRGKVTLAKSSGRLHAPGQISLRLTSVEVNGKMLPVATGSYHLEGKSHTKSNATKIGGGTAAGALIGGIAGGGKGALIGSAVGAGAGTGVAAATGKEEAVVPAEKTLTFTTTAAATAK
jgi:hypothetical protein